MRRLAVVASHPIQYQAPWFKALARACDLTVFYGHRQDADGQARAGFGQPFEWDVPLLDGYRHEFLQNVAARPGVDRFGGCDTPGVGPALADGQFDACLVSGWYLKSYLQAIQASRRLGIPVLLRGDSHLRTRRTAAVSALKYLPYRWLLGRVDAHLYVGRANHAYLRHYGVRADRLFFAPHFVDNARFAADADRAREEGHVGRLRQAWGAAATTTVFLFAGKFLARKRAADFVAAVRELAAEGRDVKGVLVGSGPEEAALRSAAAGSRAVVFDGFRNQTEIASRYAAADCLVLPSDGRETWGLVVNEAMATGRPAIVSDAVGCAPDLIDEGRTGFTFPEGDVRILSARMRDALSTLSGPAAPRVRESVLTRVSGYSCEAAVAGTLEALETLGRRRTRVATAKAQHA